MSRSRWFPRSHCLPNLTELLFILSSYTRVISWVNHRRIHGRRRLKEKREFSWELVCCTTSSVFFSSYVVFLRLKSLFNYISLVFLFAWIVYISWVLLLQVHNLLLPVMISSYQRWKMKKKAVKEKRGSISGFFFLHTTHKRVRVREMKETTFLAIKHVIANH